MIQVLSHRHQIEGKKKGLVSTLQKKPPIVAKVRGNETCRGCSHPAVLSFSERVERKRSYL